MLLHIQCVLKVFLGVQACGYVFTSVCDSLDVKQYLELKIAQVC